MNQEKWNNMFSDQMKAVGYSECTILNYGSCIKLFLEKFNNYPEPEKISADEILKYLLTFTTRNTRKQHHSAIKLFYKNPVFYAHSWDFISLKDSRIDNLFPSEKMIRKIDKIMEYEK